MSDYTPLAIFLFVTLALNIIFTGIYTAFEIETNYDDLPEPLELYLTAGDIFDATITFVKNIPFIGGFLELILTLLFGLIFNTVIETAVLSWSILPISVFYFLFIPLCAGAIYSFIKLLPTT